MRTGDRGIVHFRFINSPEYLHLGANILFREGRTRGLGQITKLLEESVKELNPKDKNKELHMKKDKIGDKHKN